MVSKKDAINNLKNVKLIIGNGFDLHCGLKSSYSDYFKAPSNKDKFDDIIHWLNSLEGKKNISFDEASKAVGNFFVEKKLKKTSLWDLFFAMDRNKSRAWNDVESLISASLIRNYENVNRPSSVAYWDDVQKIIAGNLYSPQPVHSMILAAFMIKKAGGDTESLKGDRFYFFLKNELSKFENDFGQYISNQVCFPNSFFNHLNRFFVAYVSKTLGEICNLDNVVSLDTFNFTPCMDFKEFDKIKDKVRYVNGNWASPIFGIDSSTYPSSDVRNIFSKTYRRMELDMILDESAPTPDFSNAIVFGHSLSSNDYSYFFPLLDKLNMTDFASNSKIIFDYSVYDKEKEVSIRQDYCHAIYKLFEAYAISKGMSEEPGRLLDGLTTQGRVLINEVEDIPAARQIGYLSPFGD